MDDILCGEIERLKGEVARLTVERDEARSLARKYYRESSAWEKAFCDLADYVTETNRRLK